MKVLVGEKVINKAGLKGTIISIDSGYIEVDFESRIARFTIKAFEQGYLKYENVELQYNEEIEKNRAEEKLKQKKQDEENDSIKERLAEKASLAEQGTIITNDASISIYLNSTPVNNGTFKKKEKELFEAIFDACDNDFLNVPELFKFKMKYNKYTDYSKTSYTVGVVKKYIDTYVVRIFYRCDAYKNRRKTGVRIFEINLAEIARIICFDGKIYEYSKNFASQGCISRSERRKVWHKTFFSENFILNEVIRDCDCNYLNAYVNKKNATTICYVSLLLNALNNSKAEIVFKNKLYNEVYHIKNLSKYLNDFSTKQIAFASKNGVFNTLPFIKKHGIYDIKIIKTMELIMGKLGYRDSIYEILCQEFNRLGFNNVDIDKRILNFINRISDFQPVIYYDYINELSNLPEKKVDDYFANDYIDRHYDMIEERDIYYSIRDKNEYILKAKELSWIDREENGYFIRIPKRIEDFKYEGDIQHNCLFKLRYFDEVINNSSIIVFLRKIEYEPYVTIEYSRQFKVIQAFKKFNTPVEKKLYDYIVELGKRLFEESAYQINNNI